jgi:GxxExxY protein
MNADRSYRREGSLRRKLIEEELTRLIIGAFFEVYNALGFGFLESIYKRALEIALRQRSLVVDREFPVEIFFAGQQVGFHRIDLLVERRVIVEVKATHKLAYADRLQLMNYVTAMHMEVGLLLHFGPRPNFKRVLGGWRPETTRSDPG